MRGAFGCHCPIHQEEAKGYFPSLKLQHLCTVSLVTFVCLLSSVSILLCRHDKHAFPVSDECAYSHNHGIELARVQGKGQPGRVACNFANGTRATDYTDVWRCKHEAKCHIADEFFQMVVFRDPRPAVVSVCCHLRLSRNMDFETVEAFVQRELPIYCHSLAIRHIFFSGFQPHECVQFWFNDVMADPVEWHYNSVHAVGLQLLFRVVETTAKAAQEN